MPSVTQESLDGADQDLIDAWTLLAEKIGGQPHTKLLAGEVAECITTCIGLHGRAREEGRSEYAARVAELTKLGGDSAGLRSDLVHLEEAWRVAQHQLARATAERDKADALCAAAMDERDDAALEGAQLRGKLAAACRGADLLRGLLLQCAPVIAEEIERCEKVQFWPQESSDRIERLRLLLRAIGTPDLPNGATP